VFFAASEFGKFRWCKRLPPHLNPLPSGERGAGAKNNGASAMSKEHCLARPLRCEAGAPYSTEGEKVSPLTEARKGKTGEGKGVSGVQPLNILRRCPPHLYPLPQGERIVSPRGRGRQGFQGGCYPLMNTTGEIDGRRGKDCTGWC